MCGDVYVILLVLALWHQIESSTALRSYDVVEVESTQPRVSSVSPTGSKAGHT